MENSISGVKFSNSFNLKTNTYKTDKIEIKTDYEVMPFQENLPPSFYDPIGNTITDETEKDKEKEVEEKKVEEKNIEEQSSTWDFLTRDWVKDKGTNTLVWAATKDFVATGAGIISDKSIVGIITISLLEGGYKEILSNVSGKTDINSSEAGDAVLISGFLKALSSKGGKNLAKKLPLFSGFTSTKIFEDFLDSSKIIDIYVKNSKTITDKEVFKQIIERHKAKEGNIFQKENIYKKIFKNTPGLAQEYFKQVTGSMTLGIGIDYGASIVANFASAKIQKKEINYETLKGGSTLLKSSTKVICATAGTLIMGSFGKAELGKKIGTCAGAIIAEVQVELLDKNERWCTIAACTEIAGAVAGAAVVVLLCSNPAGWVVGAAILAGAAIGFTVTFLAYKSDAIREWVDDKIDVAQEFIDDKIDDAKEVVKDLKKTAEKKVKANPVTNFLIGWAF